MDTNLFEVQPPFTLLSFVIDKVIDVFKSYGLETHVGSMSTLVYGDVNQSHYKIVCVKK